MDGSGALKNDSPSGLVDIGYYVRRIVLNAVRAQPRERQKAYLTMAYEQGALTDFELSQYIAELGLQGE